MHLGHRELLVEVHHLAHVDLAARGRGAVGRAVLDDRTSGVVSLPESAVEDRGEPLLEPSGQLGRVAPRLDGPQGLVVALHHALDILRAAGAALDLEHAHPCGEHPVQEVDRAEVLGREDILPVDVELRAGLLVCQGVFAAAQLAAGPAVGRAARLVEREVALARDGHAEGAVGEHLDLHELAARSADVVLDDPAVDFGHLLERELACQHHRVGPLRVEAHRLGVRDVALRGDVHLLPDAPRVENRRQVGGDDGVDALAAGAVDHLVHGRHLVLVDDGVDRQVGLDARFVRRGDDAPEVVEREVRRRSRAHVEFPDAEVDGVGTGLDGRGEGLVGARGGHDLDIGSFHGVLIFCGPSDSRRRRASAVCALRAPRACRGSRGPARSAARSAARSGAGCPAGRRRPSRRRSARRR